MEYEQNDKSGEGSLLDRIKESPRTVSALIIILIVAAAIYAFSGEEGQPAGTVPADQAATEQEGQPAADTVDGGIAQGTILPEAAAPPTPTVAPLAPEELAAQSQLLPAVERNEQGFVEKAAAGDGITHLARRAATRYLSQNTIDYAVTNEHRIYIEDYIKDNVGSRPLAVGEEQTISFELIREAVAAAGQLNEQQLHNLSQYTYALT